MVGIGRLQSQIVSKACAWAEAERGRFILFVPVWLGIGIALYSTVHFEPAYDAGWWAALGGLMLGIFAPSRLHRAAAFCLVLIGIGFIAARLETARVAAPVLTKPLSIRNTTGVVEEATILPKGIKLLLTRPVIEGLQPAQTPERISVTIKREIGIVEAGQTVTLRAGLYPPPEPAIPGGFDFPRHFYFRGVGAVGFGIAPVTAEKSPKARDTLIARLHTTLSQRIYQAVPLPEGGLAAGLLTGDTGAISQDVYDTMKEAGLTHLLAVSGYNLVIVTGLVFFTVRLVFAAIPWIALRCSTKRIAAIFALLAGYGYLLLTGSPVSAERAFIMASLLLIAILIDRVPTPMRSLAIAATVLLLIEPHSLLSAGFQLSFAATLGLIAFYDRYRLLLHSALGARRVLFYIAGAFLSALIAGLATAPFILYHFNQIASYTILANMLAAPLVTFWIMPALLLGLAAMPFGWEQWPLTFAEWGLSALLAVAHVVVRLPGALLYMPPPTGWGLALIGLGFIWLCLWGTRLRWMGLPMLALGLLTSILYTPPNILITADAKQVALRRENGRLVSWRGSRETFQNRQWLEALGENMFIPRRLLGSSDGCDSSGCSTEIRGYVVTFLQNREALWEDCRESDVLIVPFSVRGRACPVTFLIDSQALRKRGAHVLYIGKRVIVETAADRAGIRPWSPAAWRN